MRSTVALALAWLVLVVPASGCIEADVADGTLLCSLDPHRLCPHGYYCAADDYCYRDGHAPALRDLAGVGPGGDLGGGGEDMSGTVGDDMSVPVGADMNGTVGADMSGIVGDDMSGTVGDDMSGTVGDDMSGTVGDDMSETEDLGVSTASDLATD
jgi:hypothetical protein